MTEALRALLAAGPDGTGFAVTAGVRLPLAVFSALLGAFAGLFLHRCIVRIPNEQPIFARGPVGDGKEQPWHTVWRLAVVEGLTVLLFALVAWFLPSSIPAGADGEPVLRALWLLPIGWLFVSGVLIGAFVDLEHMIVPDRISIGGTLAGLLLSAIVPEMQSAATWRDGLVLSAIGVTSGSVPLWLGDAAGSWWFRRRGRIAPGVHVMGLGDIKLVAAFGAFLGWRGAMFGILVGIWLFVLVSLPLLALGRRRILDKIPFGPYLSAAALLWLFWGPRIAALFSAASHSR